MQSRCNYLRISRQNHPGFREVPKSNDWHPYQRRSEGDGRHKREDNVNTEAEIKVMVTIQGMLEVTKSRKIQGRILP